MEIIINITLNHLKITIDFGGMKQFKILVENIK